MVMMGVFPIDRISIYVDKGYGRWGFLFQERILFSICFLPWKYVCFNESD